ncbi:MAG: 2OG-Fe(II) oxygenase [Fimbriiglobus sp.]
MELEWLADENIFVIHNFLSIEECAHFLTKSEEIGYEDAPITTAQGPVMAKFIRNNDRVMIDDPTTASDLFARALPFLPCRFENWEPCGFNERFRYYRYAAGQEFKWHFDGEYDRGNGEVSKYTFMIYLNWGVFGGETKFNLERRGRLPTDDEVLKVQPVPGKALIFRHDILHTGAIVLDGVKYVMRTDVMYRPATDSA